jgi:tRNA-specific 2-thiouridylase
LYTNSQIVTGLNWIAIEALNSPMEVKARIRNAHYGYDAVISPQGHEKAVVGYKEPQMGAAPGQAIVFYDKDMVVGGGIVE